MTTTKIAIAAAFCVALAACQSGPGALSQDEATIVSGVKTIEKSPAGANILAWAKSLAPKAEAALAKFNASLPGGGLTLDEVKFACAADNTAHVLISAIELVAPLPGELVKADDLGYDAIQATCRIVTAGKLPDASGVGSVVSTWNALADAVKSAVSAAK